MNAPSLGLITALAGGMALGALFFAGLWLTVRTLGLSRHPGLLMAASYVLRMLLLIGGLYLLGSGNWQSFAAALTGIIVTRTLMLRLLGAGEGRASVTLRSGD